MIRVLGVDPSLAATGLALPSRDSFRTLTPQSGPEDVAARLFDLKCSFGAWCSELRARNLVDMAVIETVSLHGKGGALVTIRLAQLSGVFLTTLYEHAIPYVEVNSSTLKRYATGNGAAQKQDMMKFARNAGVHPTNDNEADAYWLRRIGEDFYNYTPIEASQVLEQHQIDIHDKLKWPRL